MKHTKTFAGWLLLAISLMGLVSCSTPSTQNAQISDRNISPSPTANNSPQAIAANQRDCILVNNGYGSQGQVAVNAQEVVSGLEVPWETIFLPGGDMLATERAGQVRLVRNGQLLCCINLTLLVLNKRFLNKKNILDQSQDSHN